MRWIGWFGDDEWQRPRPALARPDLLVALGVLAFEVLTLELMRSFGDFTGRRSLAVEYLALLVLAPTMMLRRRWPLSMGLLGFAMFFAATTWVPEVGYQMSFQVACFFSFYSAVAWAQNRRATALVAGGLLLAMGLWMAWDFALGQAVEHYERQLDGHHPQGLLPALPAYVLYSFLVNLAFVGGAVAMGQAAWQQARDRATLAAQATTIEAQAGELREQAVTGERLRIARELHDVVAHHVSVMGIQAAGARRVLERDPALAREALGQVEESSREAVRQMRGLLGALRSGDGAAEEAGRSPQPGLAQLPQLYQECREAGLAVADHLVEDPPGAAAALPLPLQLSLYRTVQESLANVRRHSTANQATVTLRVQGDGEARTGWAEAEVLDEGRPVGGTSGSGLGLLGMRERVTQHGGTVEIGPRVTGGYRVRVRFPTSIPSRAGIARTPMNAGETR